MRFRQGEWDVILGAYCYEILDTPCMSDSTYDIYCKEVSRVGTTIPDFDSNTGQWIHDLIKDEKAKEIIHEGALKMLELGKGTSPIHCIPEHLIGKNL
jgi:hypothetical protein